MVKACRKASKVLIRDFGEIENLQVSVKGPGDFVTVSDKKVEKILIEELQKARPDYSFLSEEAGEINFDSDSEYTWLIDPLDGTMNFARGFPVCCVSIALWMHAAPALGVIYDLNTCHMHVGVVGKGATTDGKEPMQVSDVDNPGQAVLATGFPTGRSYEPNDLAEFIAKVRRFKKIRMIGSAAVSLANVASGVWEVYHEENVFLWDVAAGLALVEAAGGKVVYSKLSSEGTFNVTASNGRVTL